MDSMLEGKHRMEIKLLFSSFFRKSLSIPGFQLDPASSAQLPINGANTGLVKTLRIRKTSGFFS